MNRGSGAATRPSTSGPNGTPKSRPGLQLINIYAIRKYTPEQLEQALRTGIREGADYLEIFIEELSDPACAAAVEKVRNDWKGMQK